MPLASHLRCVALALGISTALGCANRNQPAPRAESLDPGLSRVAGTRGDALPAQWWTLYQDSGLNHLVAAALRHNRDLAAADAHARALLGHLRGAQGERWPRTEVGYGYQYGRDGDDQTLAEATDEELRSQWKHTARLDLSYQLDLWGEVRARIAAAKADAEAAQAARDLLRVSVASQTTLAYVRACALARRAEVQRRSVGLLDASLALSERQLAAGLSSELQRRRLLALRERTRAALPMLEARRRAALYELALLSGRSPRQLDAPAATCAGIPQLRRALPTGDGWSLLARRRRRPARAGRSRAVPAHQLRRRRRNLRSDPRRPRRQRRASLRGRSSAELALPNRESARGRLDSAAAERDAALARFDGAVLGALREVERALALYAGERQRRADLQRALDEQRHAYRLARSNYRAGALDALELLDSQRSLVADRARLVDAEMRVAERQVELFGPSAAAGKPLPAPPTRKTDNEPGNQGTHRTHHWRNHASSHAPAPNLAAGRPRRRHRARRPAGVVVEQRTLPGGHRRCLCTRRLGGGQRAGLRLRRRGAGGRRRRRPGRRPAAAPGPARLPPAPARRRGPRSGGAGGAGSPAREAGDPRSATAGAGADDQPRPRRWRSGASRMAPRRDRLATLPAIGRRACHQSPAPGECRRGAPASAGGGAAGKRRGRPPACRQGRAEEPATRGGGGARPAPGGAAGSRGGARTGAPRPGRYRNPRPIRRSRRPAQGAPAPVRHAGAACWRWCRWSRPTWWPTTRRPSSNASAPGNR